MVFSAKRREFSCFLDPAGRRRLYLWRLGYSLALAVASLTEVFIFSVLVSPALPRLSLRRISEPPIAKDVRSQSPRLGANRAEQKAARAGLKGSFDRSQVKPPVPAAGANQPTSRPLALGFYVNWDDSSYESLKRHLGQLDQLVPEWLWLQGGDHPVVSNIDPRALDLVRGRRPELPIIPMINNMKNGEWEPQTLARQIADGASRSRLVNDLAQFVGDNHFQGVCIDFEDAPDASRKNLLAFMRELHEAFGRRNWTVMQVAPFDDSGWDYRAYAAASDYLLLTAYDEHWGDGDPGGVAGQPWFEETLAERMKELDGARTIICIGGYGYDWRKDGEARTLTFQEALLEARDSEASVEFDPETRNPFFSFEDEDGSEHTVWFLDGVTAFNQMRASRAYDVAGFALWRMGSEDPSLWTVFGAQPTDAPSDVAPTQSVPSAPSVPSGLTRIVYGYDVDFEGVGEILQVETSPKEGLREIKVDAGDGLRFSFGKARAMEPLVVALLAAILLPPGNVLRDGPIGLDRAQRPGRRLGEIGAEGDSGDRKLA
jgi:spore germination protein YaaH